jgi:hypothetical protein
MIHGAVVKGVDEKRQHDKRVWKSERVQQQLARKRGRQRRRRARKVRQKEDRSV